ncbi:MAG: hypothetical protein ABIH00_03515 [Armatimonadota bacterium]
MPYFLKIKNVMICILVFFIFLVFSPLFASEEDIQKAKAISEIFSKARLTGLIRS